jgi:hypothetical protein
LEIQQAIEKRSREILRSAQETLDKILRAEDRAVAVHQNIQKIDDAFMYVLSGFLDQAERTKNQAQLEALQEVQAYILQSYQEQLPPEINLINRLLDQDEAEQRRLLNENRELVGPEFLEMIKAIRAENQEGEGRQLAERLAPIEAMVQSQLLLA